MDKFEAVASAKDRVTNLMEQITKDEVISVFKEFLVKHPEVKTIGWKQSNGGWNDDGYDGFTLSGPEFFSIEYNLDSEYPEYRNTNGDLLDEGVDPEDLFYTFEGDISHYNYEDDNRVVTPKKDYQELIDWVNKYEDIFKYLWGTECKVLVTANEYVEEEYYPDY